MLALNINKYQHWVDLDDPILDGTPVVFSPSRWKAAIHPQSPGAFDEQKTTHLVEMPYHAQVTFNTRITFRERQLFVRGIQNVDEENRELVLLCEEVKTP